MSKLENSQKSYDTDSEQDKAYDMKEIKRRNRLNARQVNRLMEVFDQTTKPKTEIRVKLAEELDMHPRAVQIWFQNRRQKLKKENHEGNNSSDSAYPLEATKLTLSHSGSFYDPRSSASYLLDPEYSYLISPSTASFDFQKNPSNTFDLDSFIKSGDLLSTNTAAYLCSDFNQVSSTSSHDSLTLLSTCDTTALKNQEILNMATFSQETASSSTDSTEMHTLSVSDILESSDYSGLGSLGLDLSTQIDLLQQQSLNNAFINKKRPTITEELNLSNCRMPLDTTKMNAKKYRAQAKPRSKSFQHSEEYTDKESGSGPWNSLLRSNSSDFQLKQPPLKKRRHTTSMFDLSY